MNQPYSVVELIGEPSWQVGAVVAGEKALLELAEGEQSHRLLRQAPQVRDVDSHHPAVMVELLPDGP